MAFEFDFDEMYKWCAIYISKGLRVLRLHGITSDGRCTCGDPEHAVGRSGERSVGKHPVGNSWGDLWARTEDDVLAWDDGVPFNIGVVLGPGGGVIDNEDDSPEGKAFRESLGIHLLETPSWTSGRSTHQLTKFDARLSGVSKAEPGGLECRIGGGNAQIQSVLPPSWHWSGVRYEWKAGLSIEEVDVAPTPRELLIQIEKYSKCGNGSAGKKHVAVPLVFQDVHDGEGRHRSVLFHAWRKIVRSIDPLDREMKAMITQEVLDANEKYVKPPKTDAECLKIINSCFEYYRKRSDDEGWRPTPTDLTDDSISAVAEMLENNTEAQVVPVSGYEGHGLKRYYVGQIEAYRPGDWYIQMVQSDPPEVILCVPAWESTACKGQVHMTFDTFRSASKVASVVFTATHRVILDGDAGKWRGIWKGIEASKKTGGVSIPGLMEQLIQRKNMEHDIQVGTSSLRYAQLAGHLMAVFKAAKIAPEDDPAPNETGRACWVTPEELWFQWGRVWEDIGRSHDVLPGERNKLRSRLLHRMGCSDFTHKRHRFGPIRLEYVVFDKEWVSAVEAMAAGDDR